MQTCQRKIPLTNFKAKDILLKISSKSSTLRCFKRATYSKFLELLRVSLNKHRLSNITGFGFLSNLDDVGVWVNMYMWIRYNVQGCVCDEWGKWVRIRLMFSRQYTVKICAGERIGVRCRWLRHCEYDHRRRSDWSDNHRYDGEPRSSSGNLQRTAQDHQ